MDITRAEALATARRLVRTLDSAPNALKQTQAAIALLLRAECWNPQDERRIREVAAWLGERPPAAALKPRCQTLLKTLD